MRISCPYCGLREISEFSYRGDATPVRPLTANGSEPPSLEDIQRFHDYVYLRDNVAGNMHEYWYHGGGCRCWLVVERNTTTHEITSVEPAVGAGANAS